MLAIASWRKTTTDSAIDVEEESHTTLLQTSVSILQLVGVDIVIRL